jgi:hypothetical protein
LFNFLYFIFSFLLELILMVFFMNSWKIIYAIIACKSLGDYSVMWCWWHCVCILIEFDKIVVVFGVVILGHVWIISSLFEVL